MNNAPITAQEGELLNLIEELGGLAWRKYQQRFPEVWVNNQFQREDHSGYPPFISFRFENEDAELIARLKLEVESFKGGIDWVMGEHKRVHAPGTNWIICPKRFWEINNSSQLTPGVSAGQYMAEHEPSFGPVAYEKIFGVSVKTSFMISSIGYTDTLLIASIKEDRWPDCQGFVCQGCRSM